MSSVDTRVVQMQFDDSSFDQGVKRTIDNMNKLDQSMALKNGDKGLSRVQKAVSGFKMDNVTSQASNAASGFETFASKASSAIHTVTSKLSFIPKLAGAVGGAFTAIGGAMIAGGKQRALNLEQAKFQLNGVLKDSNKVADVMDDVSYAVDGTRFGLDSAAKAAGQFAASNIKSGDEMKTALRAVSGVASMTNTSYDEIARVFTGIAGNGRVMSNDFLQISARGLNAASAITKYLNSNKLVRDEVIKMGLQSKTGGKQVATFAKNTKLTESNVRDLVTAGAIDFKTFAKAMDGAFGKQATKANATFSGALDNTKAALSRIGAQAATPFFSNARKTLVNVIPALNQVKSTLNGFGDTHKTTFKASERSLSDYTKSFQKEIKKEGTIIDKAGNMWKLHGNKVQEVNKKVPEDVRQGLYKSKKYVDDAGNVWTKKGMEFQKTSEKMIKTPVKNASKEIQNAIKRSGKYVDSYGNIYKEVGGKIVKYSHKFSFFGEIEKGFVKARKTINGFLEGLTKGGIQSKLASYMQSFTKIFIGARNFLSGIGAILKPFSNVVGNIFKTLFNTKSVKGFSDTFLSVSEAFKKAAENGQILQGVIEPLAQIFGGVLCAGIQLAIGLLGTLGNLLSGKGLDFSPLESAFSGIFDSIKSVFDGIGDFLNSIFGGVFDFSIFDSLGDHISGLSIDFSSLAGIAQTLWGALQTLGGYIAGGLSKAFEAIGSLFSGLKITDVLNGILAVMSIQAMGGIKGFIDSLKALPDSLMDMADKAKEAFQNLKDGFLNPFAQESSRTDTFGKVASAFLKVAASIFAMAVAIKMLSSVDPQQLFTSVLVLAVMAGVLVGAFALMSKAMQHFQDESLGFFKQMAQQLVMTKVFKNLAISVLILAAAMLVLAQVPAKKLLNVTVAMIVLMAALTGMSIALTKFTQAGDLSATAAGILIFAAAMLVLSAAMKVMSTIPIESMMESMLVFVALIGTVALVAAALGPAVGWIALLGAGLILLGAAAIVGAIGMAMMTAAITSFAASSSYIASQAGNMVQALGLVILTAAGLAVASALMAPFVIIMIAAAAAMLVLNAAFLLGAVAINLAAVGIIALAGALSTLNGVGATNIIASMAALAAGMVLVGAASIVLAAGCVALGIGAIGLLAFGVAMLVAGAAMLVVSAGITALVGSLNFLATAGPAAAQAAANGILGMFQGLLDGIKGIFDGIGNAVNGVINFFTGQGEQAGAQIDTATAGGIQSNTQAEQAANQKGQQIVQAQAEGAQSQEGSFSGAMANVGQSGSNSFTQGISGMGDQVSTMLNGIVQQSGQSGSDAGGSFGTNFTDTAQANVAQTDFIGPVLQDQTKKSKDSGKQSGDATIEGYLEAVQSGDMSKVLSGEMTESVDTAGNKAKGKAKKKGKETGQSYGEGVESVDLNKYMKNMSKDFGSGKDLSKAKSGGKKVGETYGKSMKVPSDTITSSTNKAVNSAVKSGTAKAKSGGRQIGTTLGKSTKSGADSQSGEMSSAGTNFGSGFVQGVASKEAEAYSAGYKLGLASKQGAADAGQVKSPSRVMRRIGQYFGEGMQLGIEDMQDSVYKSTFKMGDMAVKALSSFSSLSLLDGIGDMNPTIRPVLDLTDVQNGVSRIDSMFGQQSLPAGAIPSGGALGRFGSSSTTTNNNQRDLTVNLYYNGNSDATTMANDIARKLNSNLMMEG